MTVIVRRLGGEGVPDEWKGGLTGFSYRIGGVLPSSLTVKAHITTDYQQKKTYNTIGYITGAVEPGIKIICKNNWAFVIIFWIVSFILALCTGSKVNLQIVTF